MSRRWLEGCVALDSRGFVKIGTELAKADLVDARWPLARAPLVLETSRPGVFAVGDVRSGSTKRVASAVGEGGQRRRVGPRVSGAMTAQALGALGAGEDDVINQTRE